MKGRPANQPADRARVVDRNGAHAWSLSGRREAEELAATLVARPADAGSAESRADSRYRHGGPRLRLGCAFPHHPLALQLIEAAGVPIAAPSANRFTGLSPTTAAHVRAAFGDSVPVLDGGPTRVGIESTVVSIADGKITLLRPGHDLRSAKSRRRDRAGAARIPRLAWPRGTIVRERLCSW